MIIDKTKKVAVIGSGIAGLAISTRLAMKGYKVTVFEKNSHAGGKMSSLSIDGYRFDTGPSLFTMPNMVEELFLIAGERLEDYLSYTKLDIICKYFYSDGSVINSYSDKYLLALEIEKKTGEKKENVIEYLKKYAHLYNGTSKVFIHNSFHKWRNFLKEEYRDTLHYLSKLDAFSTMHDKNANFFDNEKVVQLFDRYATYNGSNPYKAPATLNMISHLEHNTGAFFPVNGMYSISESLLKLAGKKGVEIFFDAPVSKIHLKNKNAVGLEYNERYFSFDYLVNNSDVGSFNQLLGKRQKKTSPSHLSSSAIIFYWGIKKTFSKLQVHNILFSKNYKEEFDHIFKKFTITDDPTVYIFISSKIVPGDAPPGCENWFVMINVPNDNGQDWDRLISKTRKDIIKKIRESFDIDIEPLIETEKWVTPPLIEESTGSFKGALYGKNSNGLFSAFNRHPNFLRKYKNIYFAGGSVHPGGGIPLCLASAEIVDKEFELCR